MRQQQQRKERFIREELFKRETLNQQQKPAINEEHKDLWH